MNNLQGSGFGKTDAMRSTANHSRWYAIEQITAESLLSQIPPERVGLNGEYDHCGLAKRVEFALRQRFDQASLAALQVSQRGQVVIFKVETLSPGLLSKFEAVALSIEGAAFVEVYSAEGLLHQAA